MAGRSLKNWFEKLLSSPDETEQQNVNTQKQAHQIEIENSLLVLAADVIRCSGAYTEDVQRYTIDYFQKQFGKERLTYRLTVIENHLFAGTTPFVRIACKQLNLLTTPDSRLLILRFLFGVAGADDFVSAREVRCLNRIAEYLLITKSDFEIIRCEFQSANSPYAVLEINEGAKLQEVKSAYRKMLLKYHPDKTGEETKETNARLEKIRKAYEKITEALKE